MFDSHDLASSALRRPQALPFLVMLLTSAALCAGCNREPPPAVDPAKAPWLDPKTQLDGLKSSDYRIRGLSAFNLGNMGAKAGPALSELERLAKEDPNQKVRENAAEAVEKIRAATDE